MEHNRPSTDDRAYHTATNQRDGQYELRCRDEPSLLSLPDQLGTIDFEDCSPPVPRSELYNFLGLQIWAYHSTVDSTDELPLVAILTGDIQCFELYIRDNRGGEYLSWTDDELVTTPGAVHAAITAVRDTYENPSEIKNNYARTQAETTE